MNLHQVDLDPIVVPRRARVDVDIVAKYAITMALHREEDARIQCWSHASVVTFHRDAIQEFLPEHALKVVENDVLPHRFLCLLAATSEDGLRGDQ